MDGRSAAPGRGDRAAQMVNMIGMAKAAGAGLLVLTMLTALAHSEEKTLWRIGPLDKSSGEFKSQGIDFPDPKSDLVFVVGQSDNRYWYRFSSQARPWMTGHVCTPFKIRFLLPNIPRGVYRLKIAILYETPRLSFLIPA